MNYIKKLEDWNNSPNNSEFLSPYQLGTIKSILKEAEDEIRNKERIEVNLLNYLKMKDIIIDQYKKQWIAGLVCYVLGLGTLLFTIVLFWLKYLI
jgi:hypothetical protein